MNKLQKILLSAVLVMVLLAAAGCAPQAGVDPAVSGLSSGEVTPVPATPGGDETMPEATPGDSVTVTLNDNGKTVHVKQGDRVLVALGEDYTWELEISDQTVLSRVMGMMLIRGAQGLFDAAQPGQSVISAKGDPTCLTAEPACALPSIEFKVTVNVE